MLKHGKIINGELSPFLMEIPFFFFGWLVDTCSSASSSSSPSLFRLLGEWHGMTVPWQRVADDLRELSPSSENSEACPACQIKDSRCVVKESKSQTLPFHPPFSSIFKQFHCSSSSFPGAKPIKEHHFSPSCRRPTHSDATGTPGGYRT